MNTPQMELARANTISEKMKIAAAEAGISPELLRRNIAEGTAIICHNNLHHGGRPLAVGKGIRTRVNANIGTSRDDTSHRERTEKS